MLGAMFDIFQTLGSYNFPNNECNQYCHFIDKESKAGAESPKGTEGVREGQAGAVAAQNQS